MDNNIIILSRRSKHPNMNINSRSGSMLVLVLIIMAVSIILITSALMISTAGRQRYYKDAEREQASLTAMSAARLICQAVVKNKISVETLEELANGAVVELSSSGIPGLAGTAVTNPESNSYAVFGFYTNPAYPGIQYISVTVTTTVDAKITGTASTEEVVLLLEKKEIISTAFNNLMTVGIESENTTNNFYKLTIGATSGNTAPVVIHGNVIAGDSASQTFYSDLVFTGHVKFASGTDFFGDIIFYGDGASIENDATGHGLTSKEGNVFFLRDTKDTVFTLDGVPTLLNKTNIKVLAGGVYLLNSIFNPGEPNISVSDGIVVGDNSEGLPLHVPTEATIASLTAAAEAMTASIESSAARKVLTTDQARTLFEYQTYSEVTSHASQIDSTMLATENYTIFDPGSYYINLLDSEEITKAITKNLIFDLTNGSISLYLIDTSGEARTLEINEAWIKFINGDGAEGRVGKILLLDGADISIGPTQPNQDMGIYGSADHTSSPYLFIYGLGEATNPNIITIKNGTLEGYVGLYGTDGKIIIESAPVLYARYEAAYIDNAGGQDTTIPNCPAPAGSTGGTTTIIKYVAGGYIVK